MILIFQIAYASLLMVEKKELLMVSLRNLWIANGYNNLIADNAAIGLPQRVSEIYYKGSLLVGKFRKQKKTRVRGYSTLKEWQISSLLFVQLHLGISLCLAYKYNSSNILGLICGGLFYLFIIVLVVLLGKSGKNFG
jgi:lipopolysaccharide export LptBFGC system permease protein LptF